MFSIIKRWLSSLKKPSQDVFPTTKGEVPPKFEKRKRPRTCSFSKRELQKFNTNSSVSRRSEKYKDSKDGNIQCSCTNCKELSSIGECGICLESLQGQGILRSCPTCANLFCKKCSLKLKLCAFCRSEKPAERNRAVEKVLEQINLPCRNSRNGCPVILSSSTRFSHERICLFELVSCPTDPNSCHWHGTPSDLIKHLKKVHRQLALKDKGVNIEFSLNNVKYSSNGHYTIFLNCYNQLFMVKMKIHRGKIILSFLRIGCINNFIAEGNANINFGIWMNANGGGKDIGGLLPFGTIKNKPRVIEIHCNNYQSKNITTDTDHIITVNIFIKKIIH